VTGYTDRATGRRAPAFECRGLPFAPQSADGKSSAFGRFLSADSQPGDQPVHSDPGSCRSTRDSSLTPATHRRARSTRLPPERTVQCDSRGRSRLQTPPKCSRRFCNRLARSVSRSSGPVLCSTATNLWCPIEEDQKETHAAPFLNAATIASILKPFRASRTP
jgi:hypothetical protein